MRLLLQCDKNCSTDPRRNPCQ